MHVFASELASSIDSALPSGFFARADGDQLIVGSDEPLVRIPLGLLETQRVDVAGTLEQILSTVQDIVSEELTDPWPRSDTGDVIADAHVEIREGRAHLFYGSEPSVAVKVGVVRLPSSLREDR